MAFPDGVMVTHRFLVPFFQVRVLVGERLALESLGLVPGIFCWMTFETKVNPLIIPRC